MRVGIRRVAGHRRIVVEVASLGKNGECAYCLGNVDVRTCRGVNIVPGIAWLQRLVRPCLGARG